MSDILTMMRKEWKDSLFQGGWRSWIRPGILVGITGIAWPLAGKAAWMSLSPLQMVVVLWVAFYVTISIVADSIAGERERQTLETLLASRLPDRAIVLGKIIPVVLYGWGVMLVGLLVGASVYNLRYAHGRYLFYPADKLLFTAALGWVFGSFAACAGLLVSLKISTVRQAQLTLSVGTVLLGGAVIALLSILPLEFLKDFATDQILLMVLAVVALLDIALLALAIRCFKRPLLISR